MSAVAKLCPHRLPADVYCARCSEPTTESLTRAESRSLAELETVIERGLGTFVEVGQALMQVRDRGLYRGSHTTFEDYCRARWKMERAHAYRLIQSADVAAALSPIGDTPKNEAQARELAPLLDKPEVLRETWAQVVEQHPEPTAAQVREVVQERLPKHRPLVIDPSDEQLEKIQRGTLISSLDSAIYSLEGPPSTAIAEAERLLATGGPGPFTPSRFERAIAYLEAFAATLRKAGIDG